MKAIVEVPGMTKPVGPYSLSIASGARYRVIVPSVVGYGVRKPADDIREAIADVGKYLNGIGIGKNPLSHITKVRVEISDMGSWKKFNEVYGNIFKEPYPARVVVQPTKSGYAEKRKSNPDKFPPEIPPFMIQAIAEFNGSQRGMVDDFYGHFRYTGEGPTDRIYHLHIERNTGTVIFCSGQIGTDDKGVLEDKDKGQISTAFENAERIANDAMGRERRVLSSGNVRWEDVPWNYEKWDANIYVSKAFGELSAKNEKHLIECVPDRQQNRANVIEAERLPFDALVEVDLDVEFGCGIKTEEYVPPRDYRTHPFQGHC